MRTASAGMAAMLARYGAEAQTYAMCVQLALRDGTTLGLTDHDCNLIVDLGSGPVVYRADAGMMPSDISSALGLDSDNMEISGPLSAIITRPAVLGGRFARARVRAFLVDWTGEASGIVALMGGHVSEPKITDSGFALEIRSLFDAFNQTLGRVLSPYCSADFGDAHCGKVVEEFPATITAAASTFQITASLAGVHADRFFEWGSVEFTDGALAGTARAEVFAYQGASAAIELLTPLAEIPEIGDALILRRGCSKLKMSDDAAMPTCLFWENVRRFRAYDQVPGSDTYLKTQVPGVPGA